MRRTIAVVATLVIAGCAERNEIVIGGLFPLTGGSATFGQSSKQGMQMRVDEVNAAGGIRADGRARQVRAVYEDTEGMPEKAANACQKLISQDRICGLVGAVMSKNSLAVAPMCQAARVPMISPASTNVKVTEVGDYIFRACFVDPFQGAVMARYVFDSLGARTAAVIYDNGNDYNKGLAEVFRKSFESYGGKVVAYEAFTDENSTVDFKAQLTNIKAAAPQFLYSPNYYTAAALIMKQAHEIGLWVPAGGGDGWDSPELVQIGGADVEGCVFTNHFSKDDQRPIVRTFVDTYTARYGAAPDALASLAYDAATILLAAISNAGTIEGAAVRDAIRGIAVDGVSGRIVFDENRNPVKSAVILKIVNGVQRYVATVTP